MEQDMIFEPSVELKKSALIDANGYAALYQDSIVNSDQFWAEHGKRIDWIKPYSQISDVSYDAKDLHIKWYADGTLNAAANCLDRHLATSSDQTAIICEVDEPDQHRHVTYRELHKEVCKFANVLKANGAKKGDRITIYMPMIPEATVARLPLYLRGLDSFPVGVTATVSSDELADLAGVNAAKVRKDLSHLGTYGTRGVGYDATFLRFQISQALGVANVWPVVVCGMGNLGRALANHTGFPDRGFPVVAAPDSAPGKSGPLVAAEPRVPTGALPLARASR